MMKIHLLLLVSILFNYRGFSQNLQLPKELNKTDFVHLQDSLKKEFGTNKTFLPKLELQALIALSQYPELKDVKIIFKHKKLNSTMAAKPTNISVLRKKGKRTYLIHLNDFPESVNIPFDSASFSAQVGVIGHELAHITFYEKTSSWKLIGVAFKYINKSFRADFEKDTDRRTILHDLGWQLYAYKVFVNSYPHAPAEYIEYKKKTYLSAKQIKQLTLEFEASKTNQAIKE